MADHRHKRDTNARRFIPTRLRASTLAAPLAVMATASAIGVGVLAADIEVAPVTSARIADAATADVGAALGDRSETVSRGTARAEAPAAAAAAENRASRRAIAAAAEPTELEKVLDPAAVRTALRQADTKLWTTEALNLWTEPGDRAEQVGELAAGEQVLVTGRALYGREEIVLEGKPRWVTAGYLSAEEPFALGGDCTNGTSVPDGVAENIKLVHAAVCAEFPEITTYGTFRSDGEHSQGIAVDIMVSGDRGWQVAEFLREYYADLGINYLIYSQQIWSVDRSGEGWRGMEDRGSTTANHYDHVHVTVY